MTNYTEKFSSCRTTGECRRIKVSLMCTAATDLEKYLIEEAYGKRCEEIRTEHGTAKVVLE